MTKQIKYRITLLRFLISTFVTLFFVGCKNSYEIKENAPSGGDGEAARTHRRIFMTTTAYDGNLGGAAGADLKCMADATYPGSGTYKALISDNTRSASTPTDWVLGATTEYRRLDDTTIIGTTTAGLFTAPLDASFSATAGLYFWTGVYAGWSDGGSYYNCYDWTYNTVNAPYGGYRGRSGDQTASNWHFNLQSCNNTNHLICVEQ